ncbi:MAG TPA: BamA/TamA family outer membrane protein [Bryobacteraceae bacterium]|nr:BamA/TamA family outer membrane protein [Bryobacteraceae bacterium]
MRTWLLAGIVAALGMTGPIFAGDKAAGDKEDPQEALEALNVNARYTIESVHLMGAKMVHLSKPLRGELDQVVGQKVDHSRLDKIAEQIKKELHVSDVSVKVEKGATPEHVKVDFEIKNSRKQDFDLNVARFLYNSKLGWTGEGRATTHIGGNAFNFGLVDDGDALTERFAGIRAGFERDKVGTDRLRLRFDFASYHDQWSPATLAAAGPSSEMASGPSDIYRTRQSFSPVATLVLAEPLEFSFGTDFARFRPPAGYAGASAKTESSNAVVSTLRYHRRWGSAPDSDKDSDGQDLRASYTVRAGTHVLESDPAYTRHLAEARYKYRRGHSAIAIGFLAGRITGIAPLFERFTAGNSVILRGWDRYQLDPLGASHIVHGSLDYTWRGFLAFYDTGAVWDRKPEREQKQSLGVGFKAKDGFQLAMAFPVRAGRAIPVFIAGLNF